MGPIFMLSIHSFIFIAVYIWFQAKILSICNPFCIEMSVNVDSPIYSFCTDGAKSVTDIPC